MIDSQSVRNVPRYGIASMAQLNASDILVPIEKHSYLLENIIITDDTDYARDSRQSLLLSLSADFHQR